jgi:predicted short-subunit dehydrogenase-like oxidoreductase (DUF2520 family)
MNRIALIGAGKVGTVLGRVLVENGAAIVCVVSRTKRSARRAGKMLHCANVSDSLSAIPANTDVIFIATPHESVPIVARELASLPQLHFRNISVCHASGMLTAKVLRPIARKGGTVFSFHPLQTFPRDMAVEKILPTARGIYFGVDGDAKGIRRAKQLAGKMEGHIFEVSPHLREFYHATCVVASNHLTALVGVLERMSLHLGRRESTFFDLFQPILFSTLRNIKISSPRKALTGPVARGGVDTVAAHFAAVKKYSPRLLPYYGTLTLQTVTLAQRKGSLTPAQARALKRIVHSYSTSR